MSKKTQSSGRALHISRSQFPIWTVIAGIVVLVAVAATAVVLLHGNGAIQPLPPTITVAEAAAKRDAGAFILDVREPSEWVSYHMTGATLIPLGSLASRVNEVPKDKDVVVVCHSGNRSAQGRDILIKAGFSRVTSMSGGLVAWQSQGLPLVKGQ
jgi:rhodanese-related sulfurtransferase